MVSEEVKNQLIAEFAKAILRMLERMATDTVQTNCLPASQIVSQEAT